MMDSVMTMSCFALSDRAKKKKLRQEARTTCTIVPRPNILVIPVSSSNCLRPSSTSSQYQCVIL